MGVRRGSNGGRPTVNVAAALSADGIMKRAELEIATLKERPNFDPNKFMDDRFLKKAMAWLGVKEQ